MRCELRDIAFPWNNALDCTDHEFRSLLGLTEIVRRQGEKLTLHPSNPPLCQLFGASKLVQEAVPLGGIANNGKCPIVAVAQDRREVNVDREFVPVGVKS